MVKGLEHVCYEGMLRELVLFSLEKTTHRRNLRATLQYLKKTYRKAGETVFVRECSDRTRSNDLKLKEGRFKLDIWKKVFTLRMVRHWNRLPGKAVNVPCLEVFKDRLERVLSNQVSEEVSLPTAGRLEYDDL